MQLYPKVLSNLGYEVVMDRLKRISGTEREEIT